MKTVLLLIAFQNNYFKKSERVKGAKASAKAAAKVLSYFRENDLPIIHVLQTGRLEEISAEKLAPYELMEPKHEETTVIVSGNNAFADDKLHTLLQGLEANQLVVAGLTANKQILASVLAAKELDYQITVINDACANNSLKYEGEKINAELVHQVVMATFSNMDIEICTAKEFIKADLKKKKKLEKAAAKHQEILEAAKAAVEAVPEAETVPARASKQRQKVKK